MPLAERWYMHDKNCQCDECIAHKQKKARKIEAKSAVRIKNNTKKKWVVLTPQASMSIHQSRPPSRSYRGSVVFGTLLISLGISLIMGISKYYPIIIIAAVLSIVIPLPKKE